MKQTYLFGLGIGLAVFMGIPRDLVAKPSEALLQGLRDNQESFSIFGKAYGDAVFFSGFRGPSTSKVAGPWRLRTELGASVFDVNDQVMVDFSTPGEDDLRRSPDGYQGVFLKSGMSFPYGFQLDLAVNHVATQIKATSASLHLTYQAFDFSEIVFTDMIPSIALSTSYFYNLSGGKVSGFTQQLLIGSYHRYWLAQVNYILQVSRISLTGINPGFSYFKVRHGISSTWPLFEGLTLTTNLFYPRLEAAVALGYQF
jgi:hypothetical protein